MSENHGYVIHIEKRKATRGVYFVRGHKIRRTRQPFAFSIRLSGSECPFVATGLTISQTSDAYLNLI